MQPPLLLEPERRLIKGICKGEKMQRGGIFSPLLLIIYPLGLFYFEERIGMEFKSLPLPFRAYCHSSLSANTRQTLAVAWG